MVQKNHGSQQNFRLTASRFSKQLLQTEVHSFLSVVLHIPKLTELQSRVD